MALWPAEHSPLGMLRFPANVAPFPCYETFSLSYS